METDSVINMEDVERHEVILKNAACKIRKETIGPIAVPSALTVVMMLLLTNTILLSEEKDGITFRPRPRSGYMHWRGNSSTLSIPLCSHVDKFPLSEEVYVKICIKEENIYVDIRRYSGQNATFEGIELNQIQWLHLKQSVDRINSSIIKKKTVSN